MIMLDTVLLTGLIIDNPWDIPIICVSQIANDGTVIIYEQETKKKDITLVGGDTWGALSFSVMQNLKSLASVLGATYTLVYGDDIFTVRFRTEDIPVISGDPVVKYNTNLNYYNNVVIKLMEV